VFPTNSAFGQPLPEKPELLKDIPVRHVGRPNTVEIPLSILSQWIDTLEDALVSAGMICYNGSRDLYCDMARQEDDRHRARSGVRQG
jgi:hypothetical protein